MRYGVVHTPLRDEYICRWRVAGGRRSTDVTVSDAMSQYNVEAKSVKVGSK